jgi:hypothetical protein
VFDRSGRRRPASSIQRWYAVTVTLAVPLKFTAVVIGTAIVMRLRIAIIARTRLDSIRRSRAASSRTHGRPALFGLR